MSSEPETASREMPKYKCHKEVHALKIKALDIPGSRNAVITPADKGYAPFEVSEKWVKRFHGSNADLGYYIIYEDGWTSWSPTKAFEDGYNKIS